MLLATEYRGADGPTLVPAAKRLQRASYGALAEVSGFDSGEGTGLDQVYETLGAFLECPSERMLEMKSMRVVQAKLALESVVRSGFHDVTHGPPVPRVHDHGRTVSRLGV